MITVLVVDDSNLVRKIVCRILEKHPNIQTITATNGVEALEKVAKYSPDIVTLDIEMPEMDGITALQQIMEKFPRPVIMMSALTKEGANATVQALRLGAVDCIPKMNTQTVLLSYIEEELIARILYFGNKDHYTLYTHAKAKQIQTEKSIITKRALFLEKLILIGASTGGPMVLQYILANIPKNFTGSFVIAVHMPKGFTDSFVERLTKLCNIRVRLVTDNDIIKTGTIYICPGGLETIIVQKDANYIFKVSTGNDEDRYKPSVNRLFSSVLPLSYLLQNVIAFILTGMGQDGLEGCKALQSKNVPIYAQDEKSSVVFGMPKAVLQAGIAQEITLEGISDMIDTLNAGNI